jgi:hypothetical protein
MTDTTRPAVGAIVTFVEGSAPYQRNARVRYLVVLSPSGEAYSLDRTHGDEREYVWLVLAADAALPQSRQHRRTGYVVDLVVDERRPVGIEARCTVCGETFNPSDEDDTEHAERADGTPCGGRGEITGQWY